MAKTDLTNQRQVFVEEYVRSGDHLEAAKKFSQSTRTIYCFAESSVIRSVSVVKSICIAPNFQSE